jgi:hypothetical protein
VFHRRVLVEELVVLGDHALDLRLLEHHLRDQDLVRVGGVAPREIPPVDPVPGEEASLKRAALAGSIRERAGRP